MLKLRLLVSYAQSTFDTFEIKGALNMPLKQYQLLPYLNNSEFNSFVQREILWMETKTGSVHTQLSMVYVETNCLHYHNNILENETQADNLLHLICPYNRTI